MFSGKTGANVSLVFRYPEFKVGITENQVLKRKSNIFFVDIAFMFSRSKQEIVCILILGVAASHNTKNFNV